MKNMRTSYISSNKKNIKSDEQIQEISEVTKTIYQKNVELVLRNRTLSALRKIYDIINTSLGVHETSRKLIDAIIQEIKLPVGFIGVINRHSRKLHIEAASTSIKKIEKEVSHDYNKYIRNVEISLNNKNNECVQAIHTRKRKITKKIDQIFVPMVEPEIVNKIANTLSVKTLLIYPITFGKQVLGVIVIGMDKQINSLSRAEKNMLDELTDLSGIALERAQIYTDLKQANERLKKLDALKDEFVSIASHELRTPMTAIKSYLWMALNKGEQELRDPLKKYLEISYSSTERLIHLVNDMLTVSRIERKKIEFKMEVIDIRDVVHLVYDELKVSADEKHIEFKTVSEKDTKPMVKADKLKIREVFQNLIGNALKFTPQEGKITISISNDEEEVYIAVQDTGPGIPEDAIPKLFQKFSKIDYSYANHVNQPGTGLGLYISKQIVSLHGGKIEVESKVHVGSTFIVSLPICIEKGGA
ncbi:GAF domain-containing sensor histidine kinase [Candidatus Woesebacteria bacterium]|nr:GAF domain-containing sensor histidine kinase [Candidatus Woesebacteria bacterium]